MKKQFPRFTSFLLICLTFSLAATAQVVDIPDPNLRAAVETALGKGSGAAITAGEMATLTEFNARDASISDLTGLGFATNLITLRLHNNRITDISPLSRLTELRGLYLDGNNIMDISPLSGLIHLEALGLGGNNISDIASLAGLTHLNTLRLNHNRISDISPLSSLIELTALRLDRNNITDLSPLVANTGLGSGDEVNVQENPLSHTSIKTHILTLQSRGVTVEFDDTTHLNFGESRTVRLIYFLPSDRSPQRDIDTKLDTLIRDVQQFYADEMERHGFGRKTFTFETDVTGKAVVHHVEGQFNDSYYHQDTFRRTWKELIERFDMPTHAYWVVIDTSIERIVYQGSPACGEAADVFGEEGKREFLMPASGKCFNLSVASHELGHVFGLRHDFRNEAYTMSYGKRGRLSKCAAEWLDVHSFFNASQTVFNSPTTIRMLPPLAYSPKAIRLRFEVIDSDGLHQAQLIIPTTASDPVEGSSIKLHGCKSLSGVSNTIEFITTELTVEPATKVRLHVIDTQGNITKRGVTFTKTDILPDQNDRIPTMLEKISGDNQDGLSITPLPNPLVVEVTDQNGIALEEAAVTFTITAGDGTLSVTHTMTDESGQAESTFTLGPNLGTNTVKVSAAGIEQTVIFNAVAGSGVDIPDPNLRAAIATILGKALSALIASSEMATLTELNARDASISDLTGLEFATNLTMLRLHNNRITDISPLSSLTELRGLYLDNSNIVDISPLSGLIHLDGLGLGGNGISDIAALSDLTNLTRLRLGHNHISDLSPLVANTGLGDGDTVDVRGNPLSYLSMKTHIPALQNRGVEVSFDSQTPPVTADINSDGSVNVLDLILIASELRNTGTNLVADVNGDGVVNVLDLILVAGMFDGAAAAPAAQPQVPETLTAVEVHGWLINTRALEVKDPIMKRGFLVLEQLLVSLTPKETELLSNYPNPFNPETWIPYRLAEDAFVTLTIYDPSGWVVRAFDVGHRIASAYENRSKAIYWDGKNNLGEQVVSGVYFYQLRVENSRSKTEAGDYAATRKMVILK